MSSLQFLCSVCQDDHDINEMRSLPCGHSYCRDCLEAYASSRSQRPCPQCRASFRFRQIHPIFLEPTQSLANAVASGSQSCHSDAFHHHMTRFLQDIVQHHQEHLTLDRINSAVKGLKDVFGLMHRRDCMLEPLKAIATQWQGIASSLSGHHLRIVKLNNELEQVRQEKARADRTALGAIEASEKSVLVVNKIKEDLLQSQQELEGLKRTMQRRAEEHRAELQRQQTEVSSLHTRLQALKTKEREYKNQIKLLRSRTIQRVAESQAHDDQRARDDVENVPPAITEDHELEYLPSEIDDSLHILAQPTTRKRRRPDAVEAIPAAASDTVVSSPQHSPRPLKRRQPSAVKGPQFSTDWDFPAQRKSVVKPGANSHGNFAINLDGKGRPKGVVHIGARQKLD